MTLRETTEEVTMQPAKTQPPVPDGYLRDAQGRLVPVEMVAEIDRVRDDLVREIAARAEALAETIRRFKAGVFADIDAFVDLSAEKFGVQRGGRKGNVQLLSFDGRYRVERAISDTVVFDERLQIAKDLIDQCIRNWAEGARAEIQTLVNDAFYVDKKGRINTHRILGLRRLNITDPTWRKAMDAISESLTVIGSKAYVRVYRRDAPDGQWLPVALDVAGA